MRCGTRSMAVLAMAALGVALLTACDPPVPPPSLVVTTTADGSDGAPGDGVCEVTAGAGDCTLRAAIEEGNALGRAAITVPAGSYRDGPPLVVTGQLSVNDGTPVDVRVDNWVTIAPGASLVVDGLSSFGVPGARFRVEGTFVGRHLSIVGLESSGQLVVAPTGTAFVENSLFAHVFHPVPTVWNDGTLFLRYTALRSWTEVGVTTPALAGSRSTTVAASILQSCTGAPPISLGHNSDDDGSCALSATGDQPAAPPAHSLDLDGVVTYDLPAASPLVDAVPVGVLECGEQVQDDMSGVARPTDGNRDGVTGCDIGSRELPPGD